MRKLFNGSILFLFAPTPAKVHERGVILELKNWLSVFYIFATLGELTLETR